ncbi:hypothetical protein TorRG33x02_342280 [Trema orientale]|uniref:Uncharacterized protein n=1 Tax=Trema orientale TaxID=63057 RepID=A0A2P5ASU3_TREOI|nr:hypothetical protein TorRG33x02_342280 [Trema orientale]
MEKVEEEDERREAAIASTPSLQPDFKPNGLKQTQLSKFQELHRRRLEIKSKSKFKKKPKDGTSKLHCKDLSTNDSEDKESSVAHNHNNENSPLLQQESVKAYLVPKQRQKLHWGLDTKERWERKANM